jgi:hypothetical protein
VHTRRLLKKECPCTCLPASAHPRPGLATPVHPLPPCAGAAEIADEGAVARRAISMRGQQAGWVHHRSLCERLARALGVPLRFAGFDDAATPYGMG